MSGLAAVFRRDRQPVASLELSPLMRRLEHRGIDGADRLSVRNLALGHLHHWTTPQEVAERQPLIDPDSGLILALDGRLDNRDELVRALDHFDPTSSDAQLVLRCFLRWDVACFARLLGSFAVIVVDPSQQRFICARDPMGDRPLFYALDQDCMIVASEEAAVAAHSRVGLEVDLAALKEFLHAPSTKPGRALLKGVKELPPAHFLEIGPRAEHLTRYWRLDERRSVRYRSNGEYAERLLEILTESVTCRLRSAGPCGVLLSGGIDSSSVASISASHLQESGNTHLPTISWVFPELRECDESRFVGALQERYPLAPTFISGDRLSPLDPQQLSDSPWNPSIPDANPYRALKTKAYQAARARGVGVLLGGAFADHLFTRPDAWLHHLISGRQWSSLAGAGLSALRERGLRQVATALGAKLRAALPIGSSCNDESSPGLKCRSNGSDQTTSYSSARALHVLSRQASCSVIYEQFYASHYGVEIRHPFRDRRLVEFFLALPHYQLYQPGIRKPVLSRAMKSLLPDTIRRRQRATSLFSLFARGLVRNGQLVDSLLESGAGWRPAELSATRLRPALWRLLRERQDGADAALIWRCLSVESWKQQHESNHGQSSKWPKVA